MRSNSFRHSTSVSPLELPSRPDMTLLDFGNGYKDPISGAASVSPPLLGIINASYSLGAICAVPLAPMFNQWVGRRWLLCLVLAQWFLERYSKVLLETASRFHVSHNKWLT